MHTTPTPAARPTRPASRRRTNASAFTLTELLIVIGLIVLVISLAVPAFKAMTGGRSIDAAQNQLSAVLGAARAEAIGLQKVRGVFFYLDPASERVTCAFVEETAPPTAVMPAPFPEYYLDLVPDRDPVSLPVGVGMQGIDNAEVITGAGGVSTRLDDGYIGYNQVPGAPAGINLRYGGVILFDGYGRLINKTYGFVTGRPLPGGNPTNLRATYVGELFGYAPGASAPARFVPTQLGTGITPAPAAQSLFGFVLYDNDPFKTLGHTDGDPQYDTNVDKTLELVTTRDDTPCEEAWLDTNGTPVLINRYNGTLIRGE